MKFTRRQVIQRGTAAIGSMLLPDLTFSQIDQQQIPGDIKVINAGVSGNNTIDLLKRLDKDCLSHRPGLTILMVGTNDMNSQKYVPLEKYRGNLELIIQKLKNEGSKVVVMTILPVYEPYLLTRHPAVFYQPEGVTTRLEQLNLTIKQVAAKQEVYLLDMHQRFAAVGKIGLDPDSLVQNIANTNKADGVHPTPIGYRFMALAVYDLITDQKLVAERIVCLGDSITHGYGAADDETYPACLLKLLTTN